MERFFLHTCRTQCVSPIFRGVFINVFNAARLRRFSFNIPTNGLRLAGLHNSRFRHVSTSTKNWNKKDVSTNEHEEKFATSPTQLAEDANNEILELNNKLLRVMAEAENSRRRMTQEIENVKIYANTNFASAILDVGDSLGSTVLHLSEALEKGDRSGYAKSLESLKVTEDLLASVLAKFNVTPFKPELGEKFDPQIHEVALQVTGEVTARKNEILSVVRNGYRIQNRLLRPARVTTVR